MKLKCNISSCFDSNGLKEYGVLPGATITDCYNEQLDSGSIVIAHLSERLPLNPYDWVRLYSEEQSGGSPIFERVMLIDSYAERKINLLQPYYEYTIELMSETKLLEKIQLPNRQWQHSLANDTPSQKTIRQAMRETLECYVPKIKAKKAVPSPPFFQWSYLIDFSDLNNPSSDIYKRFDVPLADLSLSQPTLRECLTAMMSQVGCIPTVRNGKLSYLDFRADPRPMTLNGSFAQEQRSNASDSYVSELVNMADSVLDTGNSSISETLRFTDRSRAFLKQMENLYLETRYPIYKVESLIVRKPVSFAFTLVVDSIAVFSTYRYRIQYCSVMGTAPNLSANIQLLVESGAQQATVSDRKIVFGVMSNGVFREISSQTISGTLSLYGGVSITETIAMPDGASNYIYSCVMTVSGASKRIWSSDLVYGSYGSAVMGNWAIGTSGDNYTFSTSDVMYFIPYDITPLCVEQAKRQLLETDFLLMTNGEISTMEDLAKFYYGTVGYQIGGKTIEGWSDTYSYTQADGANWWKDGAVIGGVQMTKTYIENMSDKVLGAPADLTDSQKRDVVEGCFQGLTGLVGYDSLTITTGAGTPITIPTNNFSYWFFDVTYQPLNSLTVRYTKSKDVPIPFQQLDSQRDAISSMDYLSEHESEKVDRLGNPIISLSQYARNETIWEFDGRPLTYDGNAIFQITYSFDWEGTAVNYFGSENYIMRDYFTGIQTKYRAYRYVDYSQAVTRKENRKEYVLITQKNYHDMSLNASFGSINDDIHHQGGYNGVAYAGLASPFGADCLPLEIGVMGYYDNDDSVWSCYKNECSIVTFGTSIILNQEEFDNASAGLMLSDNTNYQDIGGGVPQAWYMWPDDAYDDRVIGWMGSPIGGEDMVSPSGYSLEGAYGKIAYLPLISNITQMPYADSDPLPAVRINMPLYKDWSELLNVSLQFEYYTDDPNVEFGEWFADAIKWRRSDWTLVVIEDDAWHTDNPFGGEHDGNPTVGYPSDHVTFSPGYGTFTINSWPVEEEVHGNCVLRLALMKGTKIRDVAMFTCEEYPRVSKTYHITRNGSKTTKVYERIHNMWVLNGDVRTV